MIYKPKLYVKLRMIYRIIVQEIRLCRYTPAKLTPGMKK